MGYILDIYIDRLGRNKPIRFVYKMPKFRAENKDAQLGYFFKESVKVIRKRNPKLDAYVFYKRKNISSLGLCIRNFFLSERNKIIVIPTMGMTKCHANEYYLYTVKAGEDFWDIARKELKSGKKAYPLARYNKMALNDLKKNKHSIKIRIPYALINENYDRRR